MEPAEAEARQLLSELSRLPKEEAEKAKAALMRVLYDHENALSTLRSTVFVVKQQLAKAK